MAQYLDRPISFPGLSRPASISPQSITPAGVNRSGAPIGVGSNLSRIADALGKFGAGIGRKLQARELESQRAEAVAKEQEELQAQQEFLEAKRANTIDALRKATMAGELPEGASPAYNDYRKTLLAMDAVQNSYGQALRSNLDTLANPDVAPEAKNELMQKLWSDTGIDQMQLDPFGRAKVNQTALKIHAAIDEEGQRRFVELNKQKMDDSLGQVAMSSLSQFQTSAELESSFTNAIRMARDASVLDPVRRVSEKYFQSISNIAEDNPDRAAAALEALQQAQFEDGTKVLGNLDLQTIAVKLEDRIQAARDEEDRVAAKQLDKLRISSARAVESTLSGASADDPMAIRAAYEGFLRENPALPPEVKDGLRDQRDRRMKRVMADQDLDIELKRQYIRDAQVASDVYTKLAFDARDQIEFQQRVNEVNAMSQLDERDKAKLIVNMQMVNKARPIASSEFEQSLGEKEMAVLGIDDQGVQSLVQTYSMSEAAVNEDVAALKDQMRQTFSDEFSKELSRLAEENGLTEQQARLMSQPTAQVDPDTKETIFKTQDTLVGKAAAVARAKAGQSAFQLIEAKKGEYAKRNALVSKDLGTLTKELSGEMATSIRGFANSESIDPQTRGAARQAIVAARVNLSILASKAAAEAQLSSSVVGTARIKSPSLDAYYALQSSLGYSLKEVVREKSLAGVALDLTRIDPSTTRIVWNKRELEVLRAIPADQISAIAKKLNLSSGEKLIELQTKLL